MDIDERWNWEHNNWNHRIWWCDFREFFIRTAELKYTLQVSYRENVDSTRHKGARRRFTDQEKDSGAWHNSGGPYESPYAIRILPGPEHPEYSFKTGVLPEYWKQDRLQNRSN